MHTKATFKNIRKTIQTGIEESKFSIKVAVAWFTNKELLGSLKEKLKQGCKVEVIISDDIVNRRLPSKEFISNGGSIYVLSSQTGRFLHEKFALFDDLKVITGSYNWTNFAEYKNHESVIISGDPSLVKQYSARFTNLKNIVASFNPNLLDNTLNEVADNNEQYFEAIESDLMKEFMITLQESKALKSSIDTIFVADFLHTFGAVGGARKLIQHGTEKLQSGLIKLWEVGRLDLSFESIILKDKYRFLFDDDIIRKAQERLNELS